MVFLFLFLFQACSYKSIKHGEEISDESVAKIVDGKTTKEEVMIEFGDPSKTMDSEKVWFYTWTRGSKSSIIGFGGGTAYTKSLVVVFDDKGVVKSHRITRGTTKEGAVVGD
jgi:outer membrane protein assembly factor BamE (lipoprotein component of BamABCDE complex)